MAAAIAHSHPAGTEGLENGVRPELVAAARGTFTRFCFRRTHRSVWNWMALVAEVYGISAAPPRPSLDSLSRTGCRGTEPKRAQDHGEASHEVRGHADDERPLADADSVDEVDDLSSEEEQVGEDRHVV